MPSHELDIEDRTKCCDAFWIITSDECPTRECSECGRFEQDDEHYPYLTKLQSAFLSGE